MRKKRRSILEQQDVAKEIIGFFGCSYLGFRRAGERSKVHFQYACSIGEHPAGSITLANLERAAEVAKQKTDLHTELPYSQVSGLCKSCIAERNNKLSPAYEITELNAFAESNHNGKCLSDAYSRAHALYIWKCSNPSHDSFPSSWTNVKDSGKWCPNCWDERRGQGHRMPLEDVVSAVDKWGGEIQAHWYQGNKMHVNILCPNGHNYSTLGSSAKKGHGCADCKNKGERIVRAFFEHNLNLKFPSCRPDWLQKKKGGLYELDGFCEEESLAFEYQGPWHLRPEQKERDEYKRRRCADRKVELICIDFLEEVFPLEKWVSVIEKAFRDLGVISVFGEIKIPEADIFPSELEELRLLGKSRGGKLISEIYLGESKPLRWKCGDSEHIEFDMPPGRVKRGHWCGFCARVSRWTSKEIGRFSSHHRLVYQSGVWLGAEKLHYWSCEKGHWFLASTSTIRQNAEKKGNGCVFCSGYTMNIFTEDVMALIDMYGGQYLAGSYKHARSSFRFRCSEGHESERIWNKLQQGYFCRVAGCGQRRFDSVLVGDLRKAWKPQGFADQPLSVNLSD